ncbi:MAG: membrane dipeptidase [Bacteroidota bacterium]
MYSSKTSNKIQELLREAIVIDGHSDILIPLTENKMNIADKIQVPDPKSWVGPPGFENHPFIQYGFDAHSIYFGCMGQYDVPRWREGGINSQLCAVFLDDSKLDAPFKKGMEMVQVFHKTIEENPDLVFCQTARDIRQAKRVDKIGWILTFEGCEALGPDIRMLDLYYKLGLRAVSLTHTRRNIFAEGCWGADKQGGITPLGRKLVQRLLDLNIVIDMVHIGREAFWDIEAMTDKPFILSHSTPTMFASSIVEKGSLINEKIPRPRLELPRDKAMLEAIARNRGVLGMIWIFYKDLKSAVEDIETAWEVMGDEHVGLGSDLFGHIIHTPGLEDISKLPNLLGALIERGHSDERLIKFLGANYLRVFEEVWGE